MNTNNVTMNPRLAAALAYAARGWPVFPCRAGAKQPATKHGVKDATKDEATIRSWWERAPGLGVAIATGTASGLYVVDEDDGGSESIAALALPSTYTVRTPSGGRHFYFALPDGLELPNSAKTKLGVGVDTRGRGGYVLGPPSVVNGRAYEVEIDAEIAPLPQNVIERLLPKARPTSQAGDRDDIPPSSYGEAALRREFTRVAAAPDGSRNHTLNTAAFSLGQLVGAGLLGEEQVQAELLKAARRCGLDDDEIVATLASGLSDGRREPRRFEADETVAGRWERLSWPTLDPAALRGLAGDVVRAIEPHSEADPVAILVQLMVFVGNVIGRGPHARAEQDRHGMNLFAVLVGDSSKGRKGTSAGHIRELLRGVDAGWVERRIRSGLASGEGLIWSVRDPIEKRTPVRDGRVETGTKVEVIDGGEPDKRALFLESEFAGVLRVLEREGNTLSAIIRNAWDRGDLETVTKNSPARATNAHVSCVGHITAQELRRYLGRTEAGNGFANRFGFFCVRRSKLLPEGGQPDPDALEALTARLHDVVEHARGVGELCRDAEARATWARVYEALSAARPGLLGSVTSRGEAQVLRLSALYALLDLDDAVRAHHIEAAHALWTYAEDSAGFIFGDALGDPMADAVLDALRAAGRHGMKMTDLHAHFRNNRNAQDLRRALGLLRDCGLAEVRAERTEGRSAERWAAIQRASAPTKETKETKEAPPPSDALDLSSSTSFLSYASGRVSQDELDPSASALLALVEDA